ncbi:MAG: hypothetical protein ISP66_08115 [Flavobacteriaceae bacterium]|nr:hypothetical protein [Flavobacteriaceae bacterium]
MNYDYIEIEKEVWDEQADKYIFGFMNATGHFHHDYTGNKYYRNNNVKNLSSGGKCKISFSPHTRKLKVSICPSKWATGQNVELIGIDSTLKLVGDLENELAVELGDAEIKQLDLTQRPFTDCNVGAYTPFICSFPHNRVFSRLMFYDTLTYKGNSTPISLTFYDKVRQTKDKKGNKSVDIPSHLTGKNITTYEVRLNSSKQIAKIMNLKEEQNPKPELNFLFQDEIVAHLDTYWRKSYQSIPKLTDIGFDLSGVTEGKDVIKAIQEFSNAQLGRTTIEALIKIADDSGAFKESYHKSYARKVLLKPFEQKGKKNSLIEELDYKIMNSKINWD